MDEKLTMKSSSYSHKKWSIRYDFPEGSPVTALYILRNKLPGEWQRIKLTIEEAKDE